MNNERLLEACKILVGELRDTYKDWEGAEQFNGTAERLTRMYQELCWSPETINLELEKHLKTFRNNYSEMLVEGPIKVWTLCPHHLLPVRMLCWVGYVPNGSVLGLSKIARLTETMAKRPVMQEQFSDELADMLMVKLNPKGIGVTTKGSHGCMISRGVKQEAPVVTSSLRGCMLKEAPARQEFYSLIKELRD